MLPLHDVEWPAGQTTAAGRLLSMGAIACFMVLLVAMPTTTRAQSLSEQDVIRIAREGAPALRMAEVSARIAAAQVQGVGLWPNPSISYQRQQTFDPQAESQDTVMLTVPLALGGRRDAQRGLAETALAQAEGRRDVTRSDATADALALFYRALAAERRVAIEQAMREQLEEATRVLESREAAGETSGYATARLTLESELARSRYETAIVTRHALRAQLAGALGLSEGTTLPALSGTFETPGPGSLSELTAEAFDSRAELLAARHTEAVANDARGAASLAWIPNIALSAGYQNMNETGLGHGFNVQVSVQLPIFGRGQGLLARANAAARGAAARAEALGDLIRSQVAASHLRLTGMIAERDRFERRSAPHIEVLLRAAGSGFVGGERTLVELIDAQRISVDVARRRLALDLSVRLADVELRRATGAFR